MSSQTITLPEGFAVKQGEAQTITLPKGFAVSKSTKMCFCGLHRAGNPEDCLVVPNYEKHLLDKKCKFCGVGHMKQKTPNGLYHRLDEMGDGGYCCDGDCDMMVLKQLLLKSQEDKTCRKDEKIEME